MPTINTNSLFNNTGGLYNAGATGSVLTTGATGSNSWITSAISNGTTYNKLNVDHALSVEGELLLNGVSVDKRFKKLEDYFGIIQTNDKLEDRWEDLKKLGDEYRKLEAHLLRKEQVWAKLKND